MCWITIIVLLILLVGSNAVDDADEPTNSDLDYLSQYFGPEALELADGFRTCLGDDDQFFMVITNIADVAHYLKSRFYAHNTEELIVTFLKIALLACENDYHETDNDILILTESVINMADSGYDKLRNFLNNLLKIFETDATLGSYLLTRIGFMLRRERFIKKTPERRYIISNAIDNLTFVVRSLLERDAEKIFIKRAVGSVMEMYDHCYIYAGLILQVLVKTIEYSKHIPIGDIENVLIKFLYVSEYMIEHGLADILVEIMEKLLIASERFHFCQQQFIESLDRFLMDLEQVLNTKCDEKLLDFIETIDELDCSA